MSLSGSEREGLPISPGNQCSPGQTTERHIPIASQRATDTSRNRTEEGYIMSLFSPPWAVQRYKPFRAGVAAWLPQEGPEIPTLTRGRME